jgi:hypothetical protein
MWKLEAPEGGLPFAEFKTLEHSPSGTDLICHIKEDKLEFLHSLNKKIRISVTRAYPPPKSENVQLLTSGQRIVITLLRSHSCSSVRDSLPAWALFYPDH